MTNTEKMIVSIADFCFMLGRRGKYSKEETIGLFGDAMVSELYDAICNRAEPVYAYSTAGELAMTVMYRGAKLFPNNATLLWRQPTLSVDITELATNRYIELWLLDDMKLAIVSCLQTVYGDEDTYITEYREYKGDQWPMTEPFPDLIDFLDRLDSLIPDEFDPDETIVYEG